ncbi:MAG: SLBB domain-containing protein [candidate division WOR-3 bacterium]
MPRRLPVILALGLSLSAFAQEGTIPTGMATGSGIAPTAASVLGLGVSPVASLVGVESPIISEQYVLMPGDKLMVTVNGSVTYSYEAWITYEGKLFVSIPNIGIADAITLSGLTLKDAQDTLSAAIGRYFRKVKVKLTLTGLRSGIVFLTGEIEYPGAYNASPVERVSQIIARAGGVSPLGSRTNIKLIRNGVVHSIVDIERFENKGDLLANPFVESGDIIQIPPVEGLVTVKGAVFGRGQYRLRTSALTTEKERVSEGIYELKAGDRVSDIISKAGGITPWADISNAYVERLVVGGEGTRKRIRLDLRGILFEGDTLNDLALMNDDVLVVPPINTQVYVEGEVAQPGAYNFTPNQRASTYIGQAGGPTTYAHMNGGVVIRNGRRQSLRPDPMIEPGDIVFVPRQTFKWWQDYATVLSAVGIPVASIMISLAALQRN